MKPLYLSLIIAVLLISLVTAQGIISSGGRGISIDRNRIDWASRDAKVADLQYNFTEEDRGDGMVWACVWTQRPAEFKAGILGCNLVNVSNGEVPSDAEQGIIQAWLDQEQTIETPVVPERSSGVIDITPSDIAPIDGGGIRRT